MHKAMDVLGVYFDPEHTLGLYELKDFGKVSYIKKRFFSSPLRRKLSLLLEITNTNDKWATIVLQFGDNDQAYVDVVSELRFAYLAFINIEQSSTSWMTKEHKALRNALLT